MLATDRYNLKFSDQSVQSYQITNFHLKLYPNSFINVTKTIKLDEDLSKSLEFYSYNLSNNSSKIYKSFCIFTKNPSKYLAELQLSTESQFSYKSIDILDTCLKSPKNLSHFQIIHSVEYLLTYSDVNEKGFATKSFFLDICVNCAVEANSFIFPDKSLNFILNIEANIFVNISSGQMVCVDMFVNNSLKKVFMIRKVNEGSFVGQVTFDVSHLSKL